MRKICSRLRQAGTDAGGDLDLRLQELRDDMAMQQVSTLAENRSRRLGGHVTRKYSSSMPRLKEGCRHAI
jgi:hypothetical protein